MYKLIILSVVDRLFKKLAKKDRNQLEAIGKKIAQLQENPYIGKPLHFPLQNMRRVHVFKSFVMVYDIQENEKSIIIRAYEHHDSVYKR